MLIKTILRIILIVLVFQLSTVQKILAQSQYKITLYRAAPGELLPLIETLKNKKLQYQQNGGDQAFIVRHSQGDQWDFMVYEHIENYQKYYASTGKLHEVFTPIFGDDFYQMVAFHESFYAMGPDYESVAALFKENGFFHVELFVALPGKQTELLKQRNMENDYLKEIGRGENLIFTVDQGAQWDCFTLGGYRDIKHFAESADIAEEVEERAAIKAGFKGVNHISPYLRSLIAMHHDTLGGKLD